MKSEHRKLRLSAEERETIILFDDSSKECTVYTCSKPIMTKLDKLCISNPDSWSLKDKDAESKTYLTEKSLICFRSEKVTRELTEEQRANVAKRFKQAKEKSI
jgi:hypothetical protein